MKLILIYCVIGIILYGVANGIGLNSKSNSLRAENLQNHTVSKPHLENNHPPSHPLKGIHDRMRQMSAAASMNISTLSTSFLETSEFGIQSVKFPVANSVPSGHVKFMFKYNSDCSGQLMYKNVFPLGICVPYTITGSTTTYSAIFRLNKEHTQVGIFGYKNKGCTTPERSNYQHFSINSCYSNGIIVNIENSVKAITTGWVVKYYASSNCKGYHSSYINLPFCHWNQYQYDCATDFYVYFSTSACDPGTVAFTEYAGLNFLSTCQAGDYHNQSYQIKCLGFSY